MIRGCLEGMMIWTILAIGAVILLLPIILPTLIPLAIIAVLLVGGSWVMRALVNCRWFRRSVDEQNERNVRRYAHLNVGALPPPLSPVDRLERVGAQQKKEAVLDHSSGKPFRIYETNGLKTAAKWLQQRCLYAETYDDGRLKGYVVYEGRYDGIKVVGVSEFNKRYRRWVG